VSWITHKSNYKNDFYKKILDKRIFAYESLNTIVGRLSILTQIDEGVVPFICYDRNSLDNFQIDLASIISLSFWLSPNTSGKLTELNVYLQNNISNKLNSEKSLHVQNNEIKNLGVAHIEKIRTFRIELQDFMYEDISKMHKVANFFKRGEDNRDYAVYKPEH